MRMGRRRREKGRKGAEAGGRSQQKRRDAKAPKNPGARAPLDLRLDTVRRQKTNESEVSGEKRELDHLYKNLQKNIGGNGVQRNDFASNGKTERKKKILGQISKEGREKGWFEEGSSGKNRGGLKRNIQRRGKRDAGRQKGHHHGIRPKSDAVNNRTKPFGWHKGNRKAQKKTNESERGKHFEQVTTE